MQRSLSIGKLLCEAFDTPTSRMAMTTLQTLEPLNRRCLLGSGCLRYFVKFGLFVGRQKEWMRSPPQGLGVAMMATALTEVDFDGTLLISNAFNRLSTRRVAFESNAMIAY
jgi:hypothetical protein